MPSLGLIALVIVLATTIRWFWRAWQVNVPSAPYLFQALVGAGLIIGIAGLSADSGPTASAWAIGVAVLFLYLSSTGAQKVTGNAIGVGDKLPAFSAPDENGEPFDSATLAGSRVLLKFFRGHW